MEEGKEMERRERKVEERRMQGRGLQSYIGGILMNWGQ